ncbi:dipeptide ABC transporter ATP-binding protein [Steroidobacter sp.]|uniref:dipeptide ABC transporter ATP-binding protein n=1 Tax=Steroidobacter sp. TaxID=1978227 RepID=UPI001A5626B8|nr:ABC transporter ATP-binding protein [Steroidobacter sp.]MBL8270483.1 ABC transporter ATP-binding protein [Steroidobacter sp.]
MNVGPVRVIASMPEPVTAVLGVADLTIRFGSHVAVEGASLQIVPGEIIGLVGESGSGKTLLGRALLDLLPESAVRTGEIRFEGRSFAGFNAEQLRQLRGAAVGLIFQEPLTSLNPALSIARQLTEAQMLHYSIDKNEAEARAVNMLARVGFADPKSAMDRYPHEFSGGMRQRIMIAGVMLLRPKVVIADEPTTALDSINQQDVLNLLVELTREAGTAVLLISHDLGLVASYASRLIVMQSGRIVEEGLTSAILSAPRETYTRALLESVPKRRELVSQVQSVDALKVEALDITYPGTRRLFRRSSPVNAVRNVSLRVARGETVGLVGQSGSGKTSIARVIMGLVPPTRGRIEIDGVDFASLSRRDARRRRIGIVFQDPFSSLDPRMRVEQIIAEPLRDLPGVTAAERRQRVARLLEGVGLGVGFADRFPHQLSGGQRQRVAIARALVAEPQLLVADEPCAALDVTVQTQVLQLLRTLQQTHGFGCLFISHDLAVVEEIAHRVVVLHRGAIMEEGSRESVLRRPQHPYTRRLVASFPELITERTSFSVRRRVLPEQSAGAARYLDPEHMQGVGTLIEVEPGHRVLVAASN